MPAVRNNRTTAAAEPAVYSERGYINGERRIRKPSLKAREIAATLPEVKDSDWTIERITKKIVVTVKMEPDATGKLVETSRTETTFLVLNRRRGWIPGRP